jgi:glycogen debranching enzyme
MSIEVKIGDPHVTIHHDYGVMISDPDGNIIDGTQKGLFFRDTRLVSRWHLAAQGQSWQLLNPGNQTFYAARIVLTNPRLRTLGGDLDEHVVGLTISRSFGPGIHEDLDLHNHGMAQAQFDLELEVLSDFADVFEVKAQQTICRDGITTEWSEDEQRLTNTYHHDGFCRGLALSIVNCASKAVLANGKLVFSINLKPDARWHACLLYEFIDGDERLSAPQRCLDEIGTDEVARHLEEEKRKLPKLRSSAPEFDRLVHQAIDDMIALQLHVPGYKGQPLPSGGVPWFLSLFGRDSIIASLQFQIMDPDFSKGALERLGDLQAQSIDDFRDAEPGKIPHELRHGELAFLRKIPHTPYYGTADATPLYLILLHTTWKWTGNDALLSQHLATAERCLEWIDRYGDRDGDGFQEYESRSSAGYENQSWKDAEDAVLYPDGRQVKGPKALCELQGYVFDAWLRMAEIFDWLGQPARSVVLRRKADALYARFNEQFWNEDEGFYALALDGDKRPVMSVASNPGHCLWSGIVPRERAERVIDRLMRPDLWSGWGIRTLSAHHPAFNPFSYQNGSVWPHDNSIITMGMKRYGFSQEAAKVCRAICDAASYFMSGRPPELFAGVSRDQVAFPLRYLGSNVPQAWATGSILAMVQTFIGLRPDGPHNRLLLDPVLPDWLTKLDLRELRVGQQRIDLSLWREGELTRCEVRNAGNLSVEIDSVARPESPNPRCS